jgi:hypothetical protein
MMMIKDKEIFKIQENVGKKKKGSRRCSSEWNKSSNCRRALRNNLLDNEPQLSSNNRNKNPMLYNIIAKTILPKFMKHTLIYTCLRMLVTSAIVQNWNQKKHWDKNRRKLESILPPPFQK